MALKHYFRLTLGVIVLSAVSLASTSCFADFPGVSDSAFRACINTLATKNKWTAPEDFTFIKCHNGKIKSLDGLSAFKNITKLSLFKNQLQEVSVPPLNKLEQLNLSGNQLRTLDLNNFPELTECYLFKNQLVSLNLENLPKLIKLKANNNKIVEIEFKGSEALQKLYLFDNELEEVDMLSLPQLRYFDARHNPMPDEFYDAIDAIKSLTARHDGNAEDWQ